jgi:PKD repeat protein
MTRTLLIIICLFCGIKTTFSQKNTDNEKAPIVLNLTADPDSICPSNFVTISGTVTGGDGGPYSIYNDVNELIILPYSFYPDYTGNFNFEARDSSGNVGSTLIRIVVHNLPPNAFWVDIYIGCQPLTVNFTEIYPDNGQTYFWEFGDDSTSTEKNPGHTFIFDGAYDIWLTVTSIYGCSTVCCIQDFITVYKKPITEFDYEFLNEYTVNFTNLSQYSVENHWDFGDGDSSNLFSDIHTYADSVCLYPVTLISYSEMGCTDTLMAEVPIPQPYGPGPIIFVHYNQLIIDYYTENSYNVQIYNNNGHMVAGYENLNRYNELELPELFDGIYTVKLSNNDIVETKKVLIVK